MAERATTAGREATGEQNSGILLSLVVGTRNEVANIADLIEATPDVDEVVVVDMASDDGTARVATEAGARVIEVANAGFVEPGRMEGIRAARGEWILVLDADERLIDGSVAALRRLIAKSPASVAAYRIPRRNYVGSRPIRGSGWNPEFERHARLFRSNRVDWPPVVHSRPVFTGDVVDLPDDGPVRIEHANFADIEHVLSKFNAYSTIEALDQVRRGDQVPSALALRFALEELVNRYDPDADGTFSLALSVAMLGYRFFASAKAAEMRGWPEDTPIARQSLRAAVNAFWSELRIREMARIRSNLASDDLSGVEAGRRELAVWERMPPTFTETTAGVDDSLVPWSQLASDEVAQSLKADLDHLEARVELREERSRRQQLEERSRIAEAEAQSADARLRTLVTDLQSTLERQRVLEMEVARAQEREEHAQFALSSASTREQSIKGTIRHLGSLLMDRAARTRTGSPG